MINKDIHRLSLGMNKDDIPEDLKPGEYLDALNMRVASSDEQMGAGAMESLQGEIEVLISVIAPSYYGGPIGGHFIYEGVEAVSIGSQIWSSKNYDRAYPGSKVYENIEANRSVFGGLYTWDMIRNPDFCPEGWRIPTVDDWNQLITYLGGSAVAGGKLKESGLIRWQSPNTGATDESGFTAPGGGRFTGLIFELLQQRAFFWSHDDIDPLAVLFDFLWTGDIQEGNHLMNELGSDFITVVDVDFAGTYIPDTSAAKFQMPSNETYRASDTDNLWWTALAVKRDVTVAELIGYDFGRTLIKYDNAEPHNVRMIGLLKSTLVLTQEQIDTLHTLFELSIFWSGVWNDNGFLKANRPFDQLPWTP